MANRDTPDTTTYSDIVEVIRRLQSVGYLLDLDTSVQRTRPSIAPLFHKLHSVFLSEIVQQSSLPPAHAPHDGSLVDLFGLFCSVRDRGGHNLVTATMSWGAVADEVVGMEARGGPVVKLLYTKYLFAMERWLKMVLCKKVRKDFEVVEVTVPKGRLWTPSKSRQKQQQVVVVVDNGGGEEGDVGDSEVVVSKAAFVETAAVSTVRYLSSKRKRENLMRMMNWVRRVAKRPGHPSSAMKIKGRLDSKTKEVEEFAQVLVFREARLASSLCNGSSLQQMMHA